MCRKRLLSRWVSMAALLPFTLGVGIPRSTLLVHSHAGGDHFHVHGDEIDLADADHRQSHQHLHPSAHAQSGADAPAFDDDDHDGGSHTHWQQPFQRIVPMAGSTFFLALRVEPFSPARPHQVVWEDHPCTRARGPPQGGNV